MKLLAALVPGGAKAAAPGAKSWAGLGDQWMTSDLPALLSTLTTTTYGRSPAEPIGSDFAGMVVGALQSDGPVSAVEMLRIAVFSEARFLWQAFVKGRPGDLFGSTDLSLLERPWPGGTTGDLLARVLLHADFAGNSYTVNLDDELVQLRPDWVDIVLEPRIVRGARVGFRRVGYAYYDQGRRIDQPVLFAAREVAHFAPYPDPLATYRGMAWPTPIVREIQSDKQMTRHKLAYLEHAATPNIAVALPREVDPDDFDEFVEKMEISHAGAKNAGKTLYLGGGADVTVIGADMKQMDFKAVQGASETRIAAAAGVGAVLANLSEGLQGSSLNAGNYQAAKRRFADGTMRPLWRNVAGSFEQIVEKPAGPDGAPRGDVRLWYDDRDVAFLREDQGDRAAIASRDADIIRTLGDGGWEPESIKAAMKAGYDWSLLVPTGLVPVQLNPPGAAAPPTASGGAAS